MHSKANYNIYFLHPNRLSFTHCTLKTIVLGKVLNKNISLSQEPIPVLSVIQGGRTPQDSQMIYVRASHQE